VIDHYSARDDQRAMIDVVIDDRASSHRSLTVTS